MEKVEGHSGSLAAMVDVIRSHRYKTAGRGRGVLGLRDLQPCRRPGETAAPGPGDADGMRKPQQKPTAARCGVSSAPPEGRNPEGEPRERSGECRTVIGAPQ